MREDGRGLISHRQLAIKRGLRGIIIEGNWSVASRRLFLNDVNLTEGATSSLSSVGQETPLVKYLVSKLTVFDAVYWRHGARKK